MAQEVRQNANLRGCLPHNKSLDFSTLSEFLVGTPAARRNPENSRMHNFTPLASLLGGMLIGLSASAMLLLDGKIAGISGILGGVLKPGKGDTLWRLCFLTGLLAGGLLLKELLPRA